MSTESENSVMDADAVATDAPESTAAVVESQPLPSDHVDNQDAPDYGNVDGDEQHRSLVEIAQQMAGNPDPLSGSQTATTDEPKPKPAADAAQPDKPAAKGTRAQEIEKARAAIQRGLGKDLADQLLPGMSDEDILARGSVLAKQQADQQREYQETKRLRDQVEQTVNERVAEILQQRGLDAEQPAAGQHGATNNPTSGLADVVASVVEQAFEESNAYIDDDVKGPIKAAMSKMAAALEQDFETRLSTINAQRAQDVNALNLQRDRLEMREVAINSDFQREYPEIRNRDVFEKVVQRVYSLAESDKERSVYFDEGLNPRFDQLMRDAAYLVIGKRNTNKQAQIELARRQRQVTDAQPTPGSLHGSPAAEKPAADAVHSDLVQIYRDLDAGRLRSRQ